MERTEIFEIARNGLWKQNPALTQLLGLCPTLAISTSVVNGASLGLATVLVMALASALTAALRNLIPYEIRIPVFILIIASLVTMVDLAFNAWFHSLYLVLGIFIPLIVVNCIVLARVEVFAAKNGVLSSAWDGITMGAGLVVVLALLGGLRELLGAGTLFGGIDMVFEGARPLHVLPEAYPGFLVAILPPGAFLLLGFLIAGRNWLEERAARRARGAAHEARPAAA
ncbi:MAG TPA: electron transport complex subunit RsxE [Rhodocyclaceae bacterium]|nr:MAG: electron transport complex subunit RsxE [Betaproteobacteria bacterium CG2_30_68_42]PIX73952.1 MAG: electron transport complex subunit RsxE [Rhodocyclales bacterium CG_4_10_14_3_um_filter_68_10]PJA57968.1 MAG: electron transport complex subunit RsxE [Rhodocyclales bacterium CG_4_9_14_3_um_filter_68_10]HCX32844.1 electron transport complex subunit RsxE [Rhodocyclaceae bacterium]